jgi:hypothetical protein
MSVVVREMRSLRWLVGNSGDGDYMDVWSGVLGSRYPVSWEASGDWPFQSKLPETLGDAGKRSRHWGRFYFARPEWPAESGSAQDPIRDLAAPGTCLDRIVTPGVQLPVVGGVGTIKQLR